MTKKWKGKNESWNDLKFEFVSLMYYKNTCTIWFRNLKTFDSIVYWLKISMDSSINATSNLFENLTGPLWNKNKFILPLKYLHQNIDVCLCQAFLIMLDIDIGRHWNKHNLLLKAYSTVFISHSTKLEEILHLQLRKTLVLYWGVFGPSLICPSQKSLMTYREFLGSKVAYTTF